MFAAYRPARLSWHRVIAVGALGLVSAGINGWFLLPDIAYASRTVISGAGFDWSGSSGFDTVGVVLNPLRTVPSSSTTPALYAQAPVWFMAWGVIAGIWLWRDAAMARLHRAWAITVLGAAIVLCLMLFEWPWEHMPSALQDIQFPYRLGSYVTLLSVGIVIVGVLASRAARVTGRRFSGVALVTAHTARPGSRGEPAPVPMAAVGAEHPPVLLLQRTRRCARVGDGAPKTWGSGRDYADSWLPSVQVPANRFLRIDARAVDPAGNYVSLDVAAPPGPQPIATNILGGPYLVEVAGVRVIGRTASGLVVTRLNAGAGNVHLVLRTRSSRAVTLGRAISVASALAVLLLLGWLIVGGWRDRRSRSVAASVNGPALGDSSRLSRPRQPTS